ncbi:AAA domain-containing protein [Anaerovorax odorimutans]|uniref:AAA domain-containing protein n=1 Tax=Anaerovorax odorimutans TaxID=109327 RepID=UPI000428B313|nr:AAA domain-containing protein [Anaerovorax odorimutans]
MNIKEIMVIVKGEDKTEKISHMHCDDENGKIIITYKENKKIYKYNQNNVNIITNPKVIELGGKVAYLNGFPVFKPQLILDFGERIRIIEDNGKSKSVKPQLFLAVSDGTNNQKAQQIQAYLRDISQYTSESLKEEAFLKQEMDNLTFIHPESVLSRYLNQQDIELRNPETENIIFPFRFNLSQKSALENALTSAISVIEGPPGTGKTQTILNIISNLVAVQGKSVAVVSNNNEAVKNVIEKMTNQGYGFLTALLGKGENQDAFFANMPVANVEGWNCEEETEELIQQIEILNTNLNKLLRVDRKKAQLSQELRAWQLEQEHFEEYYDRQDIEEIGNLPLFKATPDRIIAFLAETSLAKERNQYNKLLYKLRLLFKYGVFNHKKLQQQELSVLLLLQKEFYRKQIRKLEDEIAFLENQLNNASFETLINKHQQYSEKFFRKCIYQSHNELLTPTFTRKSFKKEFEKFIKRFPIILSTTHALRRSIPNNYLFDYVIIDEASQVDLITGTLALSCCRNVIIVGDVKQLPQITNNKIEQMLKTVLPQAAYNYFQHNILSSIISIYGNRLPHEILREHYRCHPHIIEFCNQKYYNGELIPYTSLNMSESPLVLYKTAEGNHMRQVTRGQKKGLYNQRELDVSVEEILRNPDLEARGYIGFVTPYRKQANAAEELLPDGIESDTVHKYQGREKDVIIMSTVLDSTWKGQMGLEFVDDQQLVNVAVSRAIKQFVLVTDHELFFKKGKNVGDLIRYMQYSTLDENLIESKVVSVFDLLYQRYSSKLIPLKAKMDQSARYQSEEALRVLLEEILAEPKYSRYSYVHGMLLRNLLNSVDLLTSEELNFVNNRASLDFVIYYKQDKACALVVEVDGFEFHENNPEQQRRDKLKNLILAKYEVPILRLPTNGSKEREKIRSFLDDNK